MSVAIPIPLLQHLPDVNVTPAVGVDEYALVWDNDTARFELRATTGYDHGLLNAGSLGDDDHTQYALLAGRAGGQTLYGGTAANDDITIHGTSNATRTTSYVLLQPTAGNVGIGTTSPSSRLSVASSAVSTFPVSIYASDGSNLLNVYEDASGNGRLDVRNAAGGIENQLNAGGNSYLNVTTGNVGIGTTSPGAKLDVVGDIIAGKIAEEGPGKISARTIYAFHGLGLTAGVNADPTDTVAGMYTSYGGGSFPWGGYGNLIIYGRDGSNGDIVFRTGIGSGRDNRLVIKGGGNVGIGTTSPATALHVVGAATITGGIRPAADGTTALQLQNAAGTSVLNVDTTNQRVGIGTSAPTSIFDIQNIFNVTNTSGWSGLVMKNTAGARGISLIPGAAYQTIKSNISGSAFDSLYLNVGSITALAIDGISGNLGIKDTAPAEALDVTGNINTTGVYKVDDVQVLSNRVIDARCADVANSGDATTDGLIDALRDAMVAHGLIAAA